MSRFNLFARKQKETVNLAGGQAFVQTPKMQLASMLLTSFAQDQFYRSGKQSFEDLKALLAQVEPEFAAKAAVFARTKYGMRSITHVLAAELAKQAAGQHWAKAFYNQIVARPDDMTEILAYFLPQTGNSLPNAMRKGFAAAFDRFDGYQLAKYRGAVKAIKLVDVVNLVHPVPVERNAEALKQLVADTLRNTATWEAKLTVAGQSANSEEEKTELKAEAWASLLKSRKLGYFALLRNLRNIATQAPDLVDLVCKQLTDSTLIEKSLVLPFRFLSAMDAVKTANLGDAQRPLMQALNRAVDLALANVPRFAGRTLVVLDDSGSMSTRTRQGDGTPLQIGSLFAAALFKSNNADLMRFSDDASYVTQNPDNPVMTISEHLVKNARAGGTNFPAIFTAANRAYDRIVILSDMQGWMQGGAPTAAFSEYKHRHKALPFVYSIDLQGYGSLQFPEQKVFAVAGFSEKIFELMQLLESDRQALVHEIERVQWQ